MNWIRQVLQPGTLADDDRTVLAEYFALLEYKLQRRDELERRIEELALTPRYMPVVERIACFRGFKLRGPASCLIPAQAFDSVSYMLEDGMA